MVQKEESLLFKVNDGIQSFPYTKGGCSFYKETNDVIHKDFFDMPSRYINNKNSIQDIFISICPDKEILNLEELNKIYVSLFNFFPNFFKEGQKDFSPFRVVSYSPGINSFYRKIFHAYEKIGTLTQKESFIKTYEIDENCFYREDKFDLEFFQEMTRTSKNPVESVYRNIFLIPFLNKTDLKKGFDDWIEGIKDNYSSLNNKSFSIDDLENKFSSKKNYNLFLEDSKK